MREESSKPDAALVIGGSRGIGRRVADSLSDRGMCVIAASRSGAAEFTLDSTGVRQAFVDVADANSVDRLVRRISTANVSLRTVVFCAGHPGFAPLPEHHAADWQRVIDSHLCGTVRCVQATWPLMTAAGGGTYVHCGSIAAETALPDCAVYGAAKAGIAALSASINLEGEPERIRSVYVTLGAVATKFWDSRPDFDRARMLEPEAVGAELARLATLPAGEFQANVKMLPPGGVL